MSSNSEILEKIKGPFHNSLESIKRKVLGVDNERIDFIMDSFYKLAPTERNIVLGGILGFFIIVVLGAVSFYFIQVGSLRKELNQSFEAISELQVLSDEFTRVNQNFNDLITTVERKTKTFKVKPFFEKIAKQYQVNIDALTEQRVALTADNPLASKLEQVEIDMRLPKISVPKLLKFLSEIEKSKKFLRVHDLQVRGRYGTRLYFDGQLKVFGYVAKK